MIRFGRSVQDVIHNIEVLSNAGVRFICTSEPIDTDEGSLSDQSQRKALAAVAANRSPLSKRARRQSAAATREVNSGGHSQVSPVLA
jgi:DNA invertase Pin-like site-specific DNA recombinase